MFSNKKTKKKKINQKKKKNPKELGISNGIVLKYGTAPHLLMRNLHCSRFFFGIISTSV